MNMPHPGKKVNLSAGRRPRLFWRLVEIFFRASDIISDLTHQGGQSVEPFFVPDFLKEAELDFSAINVSFKIKQPGFDLPSPLAEGGTDADVR